MVCCGFIKKLLKGFEILVSPVVSLRQLERSSTRERERASEHLATVEEHYTRQVNALTEKLRNVEAERNLMMVCKESLLSLA